MTQPNPATRPDLSAEPAPLDRTEAITLGHELIDAWGSWGATLTPDASRMAFISNRDGTPGLWVKDVDLTGHAEPAEKIVLTSDPVVAVEWSADGEWLSCAVATDGGVRTQVWAVRPDGTSARCLAGDDGSHAELGPWTRSGHRVVVTLPGTAEYAPTKTYLVDPATGQREELATGDLIHVLDLSYDEQLVMLRDGRRGREFCTVVDREADLDHPLLLDAPTGSTPMAFIRPSPTTPGVLTAYLVTDAGLPRHQLFAVQLGRGGWRGKSRILAARDDAELEFIDADDSGRLILLVWNVSGRSEIELLSPRTGTRRQVLELPGLIASNPILSRDGSSVVVSIEGPLRPREIWHLDTRTLDWTRLTRSPRLPDRPLVIPSLERFTARDGLPLTGWLYRPHGASGPTPAVLSLHGGPEAQERPTFQAQHQALAAAGITVFAPNIRGSSGFGRDFVHADDVERRFDAFSDVLDCADYLVRTGTAVPESIAVSGRSYGGYLTLASLAFSPGVFAAGVDICGMSDLLTFYRDTEPWIASAAETKYGHPKRDEQLLKQISPLGSVEQITVPLLVVHGEHDTNVPIGEAHQIVAALETLGRPVRYLELAGEGHEYRRVESQKLLLSTLLTFLCETLSEKETA